MERSPDKSGKSGLCAVLDALSRVGTSDGSYGYLGIAGRLALAIGRVMRRRLARLVSRVLSARRRMISERVIWRVSGSTMAGTSKGVWKGEVRVGGRRVGW